jgi:hypothetical protein
MKRFVPLAAVVLSLALVGCAATVQTAGGAQPALGVPAAASQNLVLVILGDDKATKSADWEALKGEWRGAMRSAAGAQGMNLRFADTLPAPGGSEDGTLVVIRVNDYRYLSPGARFGFGIFTGNAFMDAAVAFSDLRSNRSYGERRYNTSSSAWQGIFSAMTDKQLAAISNEIVGELRRR